MDKIIDSVLRNFGYDVYHNIIIIMAYRLMYCLVFCFLSRRLYIIVLDGIIMHTLSVWPDGQIDREGVCVGIIILDVHLCLRLS